MIWLASFPRSGNTFFRNVLFHVYGLESSEYHMEPNKDVNPKFRDYPIVKTHLLPNQLPPDTQSAKSVYLIRDGRDALVSIAHHRKDIVAPGSNYHRNLAEAIIAYNGSFFGGWSGNVEAWSKKADIIIRFEDLIKDPIGEIEKLRGIIELPKPDLSKLPDFKSLREGTSKYGSGDKNDKNEKESHAKKFFRRGKIGSYKDEMSFPFRMLFWIKHRRQMKEFGYLK